MTGARLPVRTGLTVCAASSRKVRAAVAAAVVAVVPGVGSSQPAQARRGFDEGMNSLVGNLVHAALEMLSMNPGGGMREPFPRARRESHMPEGLERLSTVLRPITQSTLFATKPKITSHATRAGGPLAAQRDSNAPGWQCCKPSARLPWCLRMDG